MGGVFKLLKGIFQMGPRGFVRQNIKLPIIRLIHDTVAFYKQQTHRGVNNAREIFIRGTIIALITAILVWLSIVMYIAFHYVYVPSVKHERPVHLKFKPCQSEQGMCSFPSAHVQLTSRQQLLMMGQPYKIQLELELPESPRNKNLGMFMVCVDFRSKKGKTVANSCRSCMLHYRSNFVDMLNKIVFMPFYVMGSTEEKQTLIVELFSDYEETEFEAVTDIYLEVQSKYIEIYSAKFSVNAEFSGLRYVMFNWPVLSAVLGITANLFIIALSCLISWYQIINSEEYLNFAETDEKLKRILDDADDSDCDVSGDENSSSLRRRRELIEELENSTGGF